MRVREEKGFTLLEIITVTVIGGILSLMVASVFVSLFVNFEIELTRIQLTHEANNIFMHLQKEVMEGNQFTLANNAQQLIIDFPIALVNPVTQQPFFASFPNPQVIYQINITGPQTRNLTRNDGQNVFLLTDNIGPNTWFELENSPQAFQGTRIVTVNLELRQQVVGGHFVFFEQTKTFVRR
jgi:prepilin-type N-terminal cleavage/methylation domain-containing protein